MALSFSEKRRILKDIQDCYTSLDAGPDFKAKRAILKRLGDNYARLDGKSGDSGESLLDQLLAGKFIAYNAQRFLAVLKQVMDEVEHNLEPLKEPIIAFLNAHRKDMVQGVMESALAAFGMALPQPSKPASAAVRVSPDGMEYGAAQTITVDIDTEFDSPETFREIIRAIEQARSVDTLVLKINSHGGRTDTAQSVYVALLETKARTVAKILTAYSSGSIVAMACDEIQTTPHCSMMVHNASAGSWGKIGDMAAQSSFMENHFKRWFAELYSGFLSPSEIDDVFKGQDIWLREEDIKRRLAMWRPIRERRAQ